MKEFGTGPEDYCYYGGSAAFTTAQSLEDFIMDARLDRQSTCTPRRLAHV
jgi:hypothetical protein